MAKAILAAPLMVGNEVRGRISLQNLDRENAFSESDLRLLSTLAASLSVSLENARLFDETKRLLAETDQRAAELAIINSIQRGLAQQLDMGGRYRLVGDKIRDIVDAQVVETRQRAAELAPVNEISQAVTAQLDLAALIDLVGDKIQGVFQADIAYVALVNDANDTIEFAYHAESGGREPTEPLPRGTGLS